MTTIEEKVPITSLVGVEVFRELALQQPELSDALAHVHRHTHTRP